MYPCENAEWPLSFQGSVSWRIPKGPRRRWPVIAAFGVLSGLVLLTAWSTGGPSPQFNAANGGLGEAFHWGIDSLHCFPGLL